MESFCEFAYNLQVKIYGGGQCNVTNGHCTNTIVNESHVSGLAACLREVPSLYFKKDFALEYGAAFRSVCPFSSFTENPALQEMLSQYLDVVELHLVKEI